LSGVAVVQDFVSPTTKTQDRTLLEAIRSVGITFFTGVPDSAFKELIAQLEETELDQRYVLADREDNALALACGAWLAGDRPLVFLESSGLGNAIDALTSLAVAYEIPIVLLIGWAGYKGRDVPHHNAIGEPLEGLLEALDVPMLQVLLDDHEAVASVIADAEQLAADARRPAAVLGIPPDLADG
jgi:sulfopyruvate decarboxylase TPP-binding subunit